jgi:hypothetical protein
VSDRETLEAVFRRAKIEARPLALDKPGESALIVGDYDAALFLFDADGNLEAVDTHRGSEE